MKRAARGIFSGGILMMAVLGLGAAPTFAAGDTSGGPVPAVSEGAPGAEATHPCAEIRHACRAAGFVKGGHKKDGKGLWKDCFEPLMQGQTVAGVTVDSATIEACKNKKETRVAREPLASFDLSFGWVRAFAFASEMPSGPPARPPSPRRVFRT